MEEKRKVLNIDRMPYIFMLMMMSKSAVYTFLMLLKLIMFLSLALSLSSFSLYGVKCIDVMLTSAAVDIRHDKNIVSFFYG